MQLSRRKTLANVLIFVMAIGIIFNTGIVKSNAALQSIGEWECTEVPVSAEVQATGGNNKEGALLTNSNNITPGWASGSLKIDGWDHGADKKYWQITISSKGYENLKLSAKTRSSKTGPF